MKIHSTYLLELKLMLSEIVIHLHMYIYPFFLTNEETTVITEYLCFVILHLYQFSKHVRIFVHSDEDD